MTVPRSSSTTSLMSQIPNPTPASIWGALAGLFTTRGGPRHDESQQTEHQESLPLFLSSQMTDASLDGVPSSQTAGSSPSQRVAGPSEQPSSSDRSQRSRQIAKPKQPESQPEKRLPPVIVRDFAYMPRPPLIQLPTDEKWVVPMLPMGAVPGMRERAAAQWEASHSHLYRSYGNRADPPNTIPKTWGGLSKAEDDEMMRRAQERITGAKKRALALGLTPTEPNIGGPPQNYSSMDYNDFKAAACADASVQELMKKAQKEGYGPLIKTPPNTPPAPVRALARVFSPPPAPLQPRIPSTYMTTRRSKRKREESDKEPEDSKMATKCLSRKRHHGQDEDTASTGKDASVRYSLRSRPASSQTSVPKPSTNGKGKGKVKVP